MPLIRGYVEYFRRGKPKGLINNIWYWQDTTHRESDLCLWHSLEWLKEITMMGHHGHQLHVSV